MDFEWDPKKATRNKSDHKVTDRNGGTRIISARKMDTTERKIYEGG